MEANLGTCDLLFLDIDMPEMDGITLAKKIREKDESVGIIFVTNMRQFAIRGYEASALDFLIKPVNYFSLELSFKKVVRYLSKRTNEEITVKVKSGYKRVMIGEIIYIEVILHKLVFHLADGNIFETNGSLKDYFEKLKKYNFRKCNNCFLVNLKYCADVFENTVLVGEETLQISRFQKKEFLRKLASYWGV